MLLSSFYEKVGAPRQSNLPKVTQLVSGRAGVPTWAMRAANHSQHCCSHSNGVYCLGSLEAWSLDSLEVRHFPQATLRKGGVIQG